MNPTLAALLSTILFSTSDDEGNPLDDRFTIADVCAIDAKRLYAEYQQFLTKVETKIKEKIGDNWNSIDEFYDIAFPSENQTEHDYILTRNQHGAGFWDGDWNKNVSEILSDAAHSQIPIEAYEGRDGKVYLY
jgi:hypothetical protein